jgi:hypothetical protein
MSVKKFKFVSPGVFINEIDNSFIPRSADTIGPAVIGRATRGLAMQPLRVQSYSEFVENFGDTVAGAAGGDIYRDGNLQAPMYGTYAAKAFLRPNVAPLTYVRLLGHQHPNNTGTADAMAGWRTANRAGTGNGGGAFGLFVAKSSSMAAAHVANTRVEASLAAVWYLNDGVVELSGALYGGTGIDVTSSTATAILSDGNGVFKARFVSGSEQTLEVVNFSLDQDDRRYARKVFNTNPQLISSSGGDFYPTSLLKNYWLGETYEQETRDTLDGALSGETLVGFIANIALSSSATNTMANMKGVNSTEAKAGWFIGQDLNDSESFQATDATKLFRIKGRGHGEYINKNLKLSISNIRRSNSSISEYGSFSILVRMLSDVDGAVQIVERFDNCTLDPSSPNYVARKVGDQFLQFDQSERRLKLYGEYPNQSKFVYMEMNSEVEAGATDPLLLPFGYFGPPKFSDVTVGIAGTALADTTQTASNGYFYTPSGAGAYKPAPVATLAVAVSASIIIDDLKSVSASLRYPDIRLRLSSSDGGVSKPDDCFFGIQTTRTANGNRFDSSTKMVNRVLNNSIGDDPVGQTITGIDSFAYVFTLDDVVTSGSSDTIAFYQSGSRCLGSSKSALAGYTSLLDAGFDSFTAPFWGGFDGVDITKPDPFYNKGMGASANELNSYAYYSILRAIDSTADPEFVDMNMLVAPGLTNEGLTNRIVDICEHRGDAMTLMDIDDAYIPPHEAYYASKSARIPNTPQQIATKVKNRDIDSSYAATFYPWVQTREEQNGQLLWIPPSVAMMGVLASSERKSHLWFAPAGFNRGGLSEGAAGIPVVGVTSKLTSKERDTLYDSNINPIASFPSTGIVVFGQKTLQERQSALDRINVRRLVIYLKKQISIISTQILFEQNVPRTWNRFKGLVEPFLANVKTNFGISDYKLILDESTTPPDLIDQNIMYAKIMVKPARAIEFIAIDFVVASTGASFDD